MVVVIASRSHFFDYKTLFQTQVVSRMAPKKPKVQSKVGNETVTQSTEVEQESEPIDISKLVKGATVAWKLPGGGHHEAKVLDVTEKDGVRQITGT